MSDFDALFQELRAEQDRLRAQRSDRARVLERVAEHRPRAALAMRPFLLAALALAACLGVVALTWRSNELTVQVGTSGAPALVGVWIGAPDDRPLPLEFSEGTRVELAPRAKARVVSLSSHGARLELERGLLSFDVVPRPGSSWRLDAGPFAVHVTGTRFDVRYDPEQDTFTLSLYEGHVTLSGCGFGQGRQLAAGQRVQASCRESQVSVDFETGDESRNTGPNDPTNAAAASHAAPESTAATSSDHAPTAADATTPAPSASDSALRRVPEPSQPGRGTPRDWLALARQGAYADALAAAQAAGFGTQAARASPSELALLGDVARHAGAPGKAVQAYTLLRRRFPGTSDAALAAFTLGRLEFDAFGDYGKAAGWFRTYLRERPGGAMAREALGRLMESSERGGDPTQARRLAERYLNEYPDGPHAKLASRIAAAH